MTSPVEVQHATMRQCWDKVALLHWRYEPAVVRALVPAGLDVDTVDGDAWVSLVAFVRVVAPVRLVPAVPWLTTFLETHVRTYVRGPDGGRGLWYMSVDTDRFAAVVAGRRVFGLPYRWSRLRLETAGDVVVYNTRRRGRTGRKVRSHLAVEVGEVIPRSELGAADRFLTARYRLYGRSRTGLYAVDAQHDHWDLSRATVLHVEDDLVGATGLSPPETEPVAHYVGAMEARVGARTPVVRQGEAPAGKPSFAPRPVF